MNTARTKLSPRKAQPAVPVCTLLASVWRQLAHACLRHDLFKKLLASKAIAKAVEDEARSKKSPTKKRSRTRLR